MDIFTALSFYDWVLFIISLTALGSLAGFMAGLLGVGGGLVLVPGLFFIFHGLGWFSESLIHVCVGTSLALIVVNGLISSRRHYQKGAVDFEWVKTLGTGVLAGVVTGTLIAGYISGAVLQMVFASGVTILALWMAVQPARSGFRFKFLKRVPSQPWLSVAGIIIGAISSLVGIGGGLLSVPFMSFCNVPIRRAIGTAAALGVVIAVPGTLGFILIGLGEDGRPPFSLGYVNILAWVLVLPGSLMSVNAGVWAAHKAPVQMMRKIFAAFLVVVAIKMWSDIF